MSDTESRHNSSSLLRCAAIGAGSAALAVGLGAFGAHGLRSVLTPDMLPLFETGVRYQMYHAGAMIAAGLAGAFLHATPRRFLRAGWCFGAGSVFFCGSLYLLVLTGARWLGAITPVGGALLIAGWLFLAHALVDRHVS